MNLVIKEGIVFSIVALVIFGILTEAGFTIWENKLWGPGFSPSAQSPDFALPPKGFPLPMQQEYQCALNGPCPGPSMNYQIMLLNVMIAVIIGSGTSYIKNMVKK